MVGDRCKVPRLVAEQMVRRPDSRANAAKLAAELGRPAAAVVREATDKWAPSSPPRAD